MKRPLRPDEVRLWAAVASTVRLAHGRLPPEVPPEPEAAPPPLHPPKLAKVAKGPSPAPKPRKTPAPKPPPDPG